MAGEGILDTIGDTPLVRLRRIVPESGAEIWVKLEYLNPTGSMKDRMGLSMIEGAEGDGLVEPGTTIVEYTGGSTGPALALVCRAKGYRARIVISECFSEERMQLMRALGIGTAGSLMGVSEALKAHSPEVRIVALEPAGSAAISGGPSGSFAMQGWTGLVPPHWDADRIDDIWTIEDDEALAMTARLAREEGIFAGVSTGANVVGSLRLAEELPPGSVVVTLAVDSGFKYMGGPPYVA